MQENITKKKLREFGLIIGLGIPLFIGWIFPIMWGHLFRSWTLWIGFPILIISFVRPMLLYFPYRGWMFLGTVLGWLNSRIVLGLVYLLVLLPISLIMRAFGHDPLRKIKKNKSSYKEYKKNHTIYLNRIF
tara:strand:+ start:123 stop:515 length:393 start_codon:yes stop_codon:yes gene_type:complete